MPMLIQKPTVIDAAGNLPKRIEEYVGRVNSATEHVSVARMVSPPGWEEPGQRPDFEVITSRGEWVRYSSPEPGGAEYVAVCIPAFSPATVHRDA